MKKVYSLFLTALLSLTAYAQSGQERLVIYDKAGGKQSILVDHVEQVGFPTIDGEVNVEVELTEVTEDYAWFNTTHSADCAYYRLLMLRSDVYGDMSDLELTLRMEDYTTNKYSDDLTDARFSLDNVVRGEDYEIVAVAYDSLGAACGISRVPLTVPFRQVVGDPKVDCTVDEVKRGGFTVSFAPNADVGGYALLVGFKGEWQAFFEENKEAMGYNNFNEMVMLRGSLYEAKDQTRSWSGGTPDTDYQVFVLPWDSRGTTASCDTLNIRTLAASEDDVAEVKITVDSCEPMEDDGEQLYRLTVRFALNDEAKGFRFIYDEASAYDKSPSDYEEYLKRDTSAGNTSDFYTSGGWIDIAVAPGSETVFLAVAQNYLGEWGQLAELRFTAPGEAAEAAAPASAKVVKSLKMRSDYQESLSAKPLRLNVVKKQAGVIDFVK